jgi:chorismate mutase/prephenate dehydratase
MAELQRLRETIDGIDARLVDLLNERARLAQEIGRIKERDGRPVYVHERAEELLGRLSAQSPGPLGKRAIRAIYTEIMSAALALEKDMVVACAGKPGGGSHFAARQQFGSSIRFGFHPDSDSVVSALRAGGAECGVIPECDRNIPSLTPECGVRILSTIEVDHDSESVFLLLAATGGIP